MTRWSEWSPSDPAIARMREALERPRTAATPGVAAETAPEAEPAAEESQGRRARIAALRDRLRLGDTSVIHELRDLLR